MATQTLSLSKIFRAVQELDEQGIVSISLDENGCVKYMWNTPQVEKKLQPQCGLLYSIPRDGDFLVGIKVTGTFDRARLFQYDWTGSKQNVYMEWEGEDFMNPFPKSGYPLLCAGKPLYLEVESDGKAVEVTAKHAYLGDETRRRLMAYRDSGGDHGVKVRHANGDVYQVKNMHEWGYSPNCLEKV